MKNVALLLFIITLMISCNSNEEQLNQLKNKNDSLQTIIIKRDSIVNNYFQTFNEIQENLNQIKQKEKIISTKTSLFGYNPMKCIRSYINSSNIINLFTILD